MDAEASSALRSEGMWKMTAPINSIQSAGTAVVDDSRRASRANLEKAAQKFEAVFVNMMLKERSEEHTSELQSLMRISYAVFCLKKKKKTQRKQQNIEQININTRHTWC